MTVDVVATFAAVQAAVDVTVNEKPGPRPGFFRVELFSLSRLLPSAFVMFVLHSFLDVSLLCALV